MYNVQDTLNSMQQLNDVTILIPRIKHTLTYFIIRIQVEDITQSTNNSAVSPLAQLFQNVIFKLYFSIYY